MAQGFLHLSPLLLVFRGVHKAGLDSLPSAPDTCLSLVAVFSFRISYFHFLFIVFRAIGIQHWIGIHPLLSLLP